MINNLLFIAETSIVSIFALGSLFLGNQALCTFVSLCWIMGNLFVMKEVYLFGLPVVTTDVFAIGADLGLALLREYYGNDHVKRTIAISGFSILFFLISSQFLVWYIPTAHDTSHEHFSFLFNFLPRILIVSLISSTISKFIALALGTYLHKLWSGRYLKQRTFITVALTQLLDTTIFVLLALYGDVEAPFKIIAFSYSIKCLAIAVMVPSVTILHSFIRKQRGL